MEIDHDTLVAFAKSYGLFYMMAFFLIVVLYAYRPSNREKFDAAANSIFDDGDEE